MNEDTRLFLFQLRYFRRKWSAINDQLRELEGTGTENRPGHVRYIQELTEDFFDEFRHVMQYGERSGWPVHEQWEKLQQLREYYRSIELDILI